jgi:hypothetical protein
MKCWSSYLKGGPHGIQCDFDNGIQVFDSEG